MLIYIFIFFPFLKFVCTLFVFTLLPTYYIIVLYVTFIFAQLFFNLLQLFQKFFLLLFSCLKFVLFHNFLASAQKNYLQFAVSFKNLMGFNRNYVFVTDKGIFLIMTRASFIPLFHLPRLVKVSAIF